MKNVSVCLDVGGTYIKGALFSKVFNNHYTEMHYYPAKSEAGCLEIIENIGQIIFDLIAELEGRDWLVDKVALAFPGPFDYGQGISWISGLGKYGSLYAVNVKEALQTYIVSQQDERLKQVEFLFQNDAQSFAFGENQQSQVAKGAYFTLGTGLGSTFIRGGQMVAGELGIPSEGMIYNQPFGQTIIDDYASARGLQQIISKHYFVEMSGSEVYQQATLGVEAARQVFGEFGQQLGQALRPFIESFEPEEIVFGGQISKSFKFFEKELRRALGSGQKKQVIRISEDTSLRTLEGLFLLEKE